MRCGGGAYPTACSARWRCALAALDAGRASISFHSLPPPAGEQPPSRGCYSAASHNRSRSSAPRAHRMQFCGIRCLQAERHMHLLRRLPVILRQRARSGFSRRHDLDKTKAGRDFRTSQFEATARAPRAPDPGSSMLYAVRGEPLLDAYYMLYAGTFSAPEPARALRMVLVRTPDAGLRPAAALWQRLACLVCGWAHRGHR
jgi:hypothetical protein